MGYIRINLLLLLLLFCDFISTKHPDCCYYKTMMVKVLSGKISLYDRQSCMQKQSLFFTCFPPVELFNRPEFPLEIMRQYYATKPVGDVYRKDSCISRTPNFQA